MVDIQHEIGKLKPVSITFVRPAKLNKKKRIAKKWLKKYGYKVCKEMKVAYAIVETPEGYFREIHSNEELTIEI